MYQGKCPACGDPGPHRMEQVMDDNPPTVTRPVLARARLYEVHGSGPGRTIDAHP